MNDFWPEGLSVDDTQSPYEILESAREEWETKSKGILTLVLQKVETQNEHARIFVHAKHVSGNRTATLFSVIHRLETPYPVTIKHEEEKLPNFLKKSYLREDINLDALRAVNQRVSMEQQLIYAGQIADIPITKKTIIENEWVSDTPSEFREKLSEAFNLSVVKATVLNLTSGS